MSLLSFIVVSQKFKLKLIRAYLLLPMIFRNELCITLYTPWVHILWMHPFLGMLFLWTIWYHIDHHSTFIFAPRE